jgi:hypothetical protein
VPGGKRNGFIEKEQLRVTSLGNHGSVTALEFQDACNPAPALVGAHDFSVAVVQCAATVAHHRAASGRSKDVSEGGYAVLQWYAQINITPLQAILMRIIAACGSLGRCIKKHFAHLRTWILKTSYFAGIDFRLK